MDQNLSNALDDKDEFTKESHFYFFAYLDNAERCRDRQIAEGYEAVIEPNGLYWQVRASK